MLKDSTRRFSSVRSSNEINIYFYTEGKENTTEIFGYLQIYSYEMVNNKIILLLRKLPF